MSFQFGDITWTPKTASEHAAELLALYNSKLAAQGLNQVVGTQANALWLMMLALGSKFQTKDEEMVQGFNSFNVLLATGQQISFMLPAAGTDLSPATATAVVIQVEAGLDGSATIPAGAILPYGDVSFATASELVVPASGVGTVQANCTTDGPVVVASGVLTSFLSSYPNVVSVTNPAAGIPGRNGETANEARQRLIVGDVVNWNIDGVQRQIGALDGIQACRVYFNYDPVNDLVLEGGFHVLPRHAYIVVLGESSLIAQTYAQLMTAPTQGDYSQEYAYLSQVITVSWDLVGNQNLYVRVFYDNDQPTQDGFDTIIGQLVSGINFTIGQTVSSNTILGALQDFTYASIIGAEVSLNGVSWTDKVVFDATSIPVVASVTVQGG